MTGLDERYTKRYFLKGKATEWWKPESEQSRLQPLYIKQRVILRQLFDPHGKKILDAGTGEGRFAIDFALNGAKQVFAVDISSKMLKIAKERAIKIPIDRSIAEKTSLQRGDVENLAFKDDTFDVVCCMETFVHLPNPQKAMNELKRVTKNGGMVIANATIAGLIWRIRYRYKWSFKKDVLGPFLRAIYWSRICKPVRPLLHKKLGTPVTPQKAKPLARPFSKQQFISLFLNAELEVMKMVAQGPWHFPVFVIVAARKQKSGLKIKRPRMHLRKNA